LKGTHEEGFAEATRAAQKHVLEVMGKPVDKVGLVYIQVVAFAYLRKARNAYRIFRTILHLIADFGLHYVYVTAKLSFGSEFSKQIVLFFCRSAEKRNKPADPCGRRLILVVRV
jgi:hypothetical protein